MLKYDPEIEILKLLHNSSEMNGCLILSELTKIISPENNNHYLYLVDVLCDLHDRKLINGVPVPNIKNPDSTFSITPKGERFLNFHLTKKKQKKQENIHKWLNIIIAALAFLTSIPALILSVIQLLQK